MKVLDLFCVHDHAFEGWFGSEDDFQSQLGRGLVQCPMCGSSEVRKGLSAPRLNFGAPAPSRSAQLEGSAREARNAREAREAHGAANTVSGQPAQAAPPTPSKDLAAAGESGAGNGPADPRLQAAWLQWARHVVANTEDVGGRFAQEARRIHHGDAEERPIRGQATPQETAELLEEGVAVMPLLLPQSAKETLQ
ncbi:MAG: DUF1178 family protein [Comamonadaceae bacterium]|nr:MAG: DUF1178 family protein [Comamonadaceae bacterium]